MIPSKISLVCTDVCVGCLVCSLLFLAFIIYLHIFFLPLSFSTVFFQSFISVSIFSPLLLFTFFCLSFFSISRFISYLCSYLFLVMLSIRSIRLLHSHSHISTHNLSIFFLPFSFFLSLFFPSIISCFFVLCRTEFLI